MLFKISYFLFLEIKNKKYIFIFKCIFIWENYALNPIEQKNWFLSS